MTNEDKRVLAAFVKGCLKGNVPESDIIHSLVKGGFKTRTIKKYIKIFKTHEPHT